MMINKIKDVVKENLNVPHSFIFHGVRNQNEEFTGRITAMYPALFIVSLDNGQIRSYSYSDLLISNLEIID